MNGPGPGSGDAGPSPPLFAGRRAKKRNGSLFSEGVKAAKPPIRSGICRSGVRGRRALAVGDMRAAHRAKAEHLPLRKRLKTCVPCFLYGGCPPFRADRRVDLFGQLRAAAHCRTRPAFERVSGRQPMLRRPGASPPTPDRQGAGAGGGLPPPRKSEAYTSWDGTSHSGR
jgi:hypothetical protein